jgi:hypothetical protein
LGAGGEEGEEEGAGGMYFVIEVAVPELGGGLRMGDGRWD